VLPDGGKVLIVNTEADVEFAGFTERGRTAGYRVQELAGIAHIPSSIFDFRQSGQPEQNPVSASPAFRAAHRNLLLCGSAPAMVERRERRRRDGSVYTVWRARWRDEHDVERSKTFDRAADARAWEAKIRVMKRSGALAELDAGTETLAEFVEEWLARLRRPEPRALDAAHLRHALERARAAAPRPLPAAPAHAADDRALSRGAEGAGVGNEAIRKTMSMLQGVLQRAVEWGRVPSNAVKITRKPSKQYRPAVQAIPPSVIEVMRARLLADGGLRGDAARRSRLRGAAAAGGARARVATRPRAHPARRACSVRRAAEGTQEPSPTADDRATRPAARRPRRVAPCVRLGATDRAGVPRGVGFVLARDGLAQLAQADLQAGRRVGRPRRRAPIRPAARLRVAAHPRGTAVGGRDRRAARAQPDGLPRHVRARDGRGARRRARQREEQILQAREALLVAEADGEQLALDGFDAS
jgi:hypothetical protein